MKPWIMASRPKTLPAALGPVILGLSLHVSTGLTLNWPIALLTLFCALLLQISSNLINDYYDGVKGIDDNERLGPPRATALGLLSPQQVKRGFIFTLAMAFIAGLILMAHGGLPIIIIGLSSLFFAWAYTGGPIPISYFGLGELFAFLFFGPIAVGGTWFLQNPDSSALLPTPILFVGCGVGSISAALMGVNNLRDREGDARANKATLATLLGDWTMRKVIILLILTSQIMMIPLFKDRQLSILIGIIPLALFSKTWWQLLGTTRGKDLNNTLAHVGKYLFLYSVFYSGQLLWKS